MGTERMGPVTVEATIENLGDLWAVESGDIPPDQVRRVLVNDAAVNAWMRLPRSCLP